MIIHSVTLCLILFHLQIMARDPTTQVPCSECTVFPMKRREKALSTHAFVFINIQLKSLVKKWAVSITQLSYIVKIEQQ